MRRRLFLLITIFALGPAGTAQAGTRQGSAELSQGAASAKVSSKDTPPNFDEYLPCADQPRTYKELVAAFKKGRLPLAAAISGNWVEIGSISEDPEAISGLNCSGEKQAGKFEFVIVAQGYFVELHEVGALGDHDAEMTPDGQGGVEFSSASAADFGGEGPEENYHCRLTKRETLVCLLGKSVAAEFKKMAIEKDQIYEPEAPRGDFVPQNVPCSDQPRSFGELASSFDGGRRPLASEITGTWVEIGDLNDPPGKVHSLNCSGEKRGSVFEFVLVANGYSLEIHAVGMLAPQAARMKPDDAGAVEFREVDFGGEGSLDNYRCRLTQRGTLACLIGTFTGVEFKRMTVEKSQIYEPQAPRRSATDPPEN